MSAPVYDDQKSKTRELTPGNQAQEDQRTAAGKDLEANWNLPSATPDHEKGGGSGGDKKPPTGGGSSKGSEGDGDSDKPQNPDSLKNKARKFRRSYNRYKKVAAGGALIGTLAAGVIVLFVLVIPLKVESLITNLQNHFFSSSENAVDNETQNILSNYVKKYVLPSYRKCGTTISKECSVNIVSDGKNPVTNLYKNWAQIKLENKLANDYGIEFRYDTASGDWYLKAPGTDTAGDNIGNDGSKLDSEFKRSDRAAMRAAVSDAMQNETKWKQVMYRFKVGRLLEEKYGIKRCIVWCNGRDQLASSVADQKKSFYLFLAERVIQPRSQLTFVALKCLLDTNCEPSQTTSDPCTEGEDCEMNGAPLSDTDREMGTTLQQLAEQFGIEDVEALEKIYNDIAEKGFQQYLIEQVLINVLGEDAAEAAAGNISDAIPIIGWINLAATIVKDANDSGPKLKKLAYAVNVPAAISLFMMYRSYADEIHTGKDNATEVGSMVDSFSSGNNGAATDPETGGTAGAEGTPLYASLNDEDTGATTKSASLLSALLPAKAYALSAPTTPQYTCNDGNPVPAGKLVCSEEVLGQGNGVLNAIHTFFNLPGVNVITFLARIWNDTIGKVFGLVGDLLSLIVSPLLKAFDGLPCVVQDVTVPGYCQIKGLAQKAAPIIMTAAIKWLIPNPFGTNPSGGRSYDLAAAGADAAGNEYAHEGLGGEQLSPTQTATIMNEQQDLAKTSFEHEPFFARMFSTDTQYSLVSRLAMDVPIDFQSSARDAFASILSNPFGLISHSFATMFAGKANAAIAAQADPFGVTQYGYPQVPTDPQTTWDQKCSDGAEGATTQLWNAEAAGGPVDPQNGTPVNTTTDPCLLIQATTGDDGGYFDSSLLTTDDLEDVGTATTAGGITANGIKAAEAAAKAASVNGTKVGFALYSQGAELGSFDDTNENFGASITKAMLLVAYLNQVGSGTLSAEARSELTNMIENSDNDSANWVFQHLNNGPQQVQAVAANAGMTDFQFNDTADPVYLLGQSKITANDFANFFSVIDNLITNSSQQTFGMGLLSHLSAADQNGLLQAGLPGTVYSKEGWKPEDAGLDGAPYVVNQAAKFTDGGTVYGVAVTVGGTANQASGEATVKTVVQALLTQ